MQIQQTAHITASEGLPCSIYGKGGARNGGLGLRRDAQTPRRASCHPRSIRRGVSPSASGLRLFPFSDRQNSKAIASKYCVLSIPHNLLCLITLFSRLSNWLSASILSKARGGGFARDIMHFASFVMLRRRGFCEGCNVLRVL